MRKFWLAATLGLSVALPGLAAGEDTITIGMTVSQTGPLNVDSVAQLHGAEFWRDEINAKG
ncbi:MAG TPA: branched-chain amino acid ABC transporter substrate-binding protein, partial [Burkholderiales bacterium]|nr:branched-chain amino acid ABC transporter substrate-binding protein [Burkholderiales bacterium]